MLGVSGRIPSKFIEEYASKTDSLKMTYLASIMVNSRTTDLGLESLATPTLWGRLMF